MSDTTAPTRPALVTRFDAAGSLDEPAAVPFVEHALANRVDVTFALLREDPDPLFTLRRLGCAVQVLDGGGRCIGTFADVAHAIERGWASPWWEG